MDKLPISAKMTTYGRVDMLEEALYSFLNQEYEGESELVIVNDYPLQKLIFDHPKVRIINLDKTFPVIGEKENFAIEQCKYNTVYNCDDDDVFLKNHFQNINQYFPNHNLLHWNKGIFMVAHKIEKVGSLGNCGVVYDREYVRSLGGYPREQAGADMTLVVAIGNKGGKIARATPDMPSQIYNWGNGSYHLSGMGRDTEDRENIIIRHSKHIEGLRLKGLIPTGEIVLKPHWNRDYESMVLNYMSLNDSLLNLDGWSISREMFQWIKSRLAFGSTILELGAGNGTIELAKFYNVISIEHNPKWIGLSDKATYHHAPLINGWYNTEIVSNAIKGQDIKMIIVDAPPGEGNRFGIVDFIKSNPQLKKASIIVDDTHRNKEVLLAEQISALVRRKNIHVTGHEKAFDII